MSRPIIARINLSALEKNLAVARRHASRSRVMAVIKADGYGHGLLRVAKALKQADGFAVLELDVAVRLRDEGYRQTILLLEGFFSPEELQIIEQHRLSVVIHNGEQLAMLAAFKTRSKLDVFLKLNTGMNRLGFRPEEFDAALEALKSHSAVGNVTLMTHFACANEAEGVERQLERFNAVTAGLRMPRTLANSAALLRYPETHADWVRPGIMLYGSSPFADKSAGELGLEPVMTLEAKVISVLDLKAGDHIGYGGTFQAEHPMRVGTVSCGYADGYPRHAMTGAPVLVNGKRSRTLGRVSMDMLCVDLSGINGARAGSSVTLWGGGLSVDEVAHAAGTISYELLCKITKRVPVVEV